MWSNEANVYDNNTSSYASNSPQTPWGQFIELTLASAIYCNSVRVKSDFGYGAVDKVDIDVWNGTSWVDVHEGVITDCVWTELPFSGESNVTIARFRFHYLHTSYTFWLYELQLWEGSPPAPPTAQTNDATSVTATSAILHGEIISEGSSTCQSRFDYGLTTSYGSTTSWGGSLTTGETFGYSISGLTSGNTYHFRAWALNDEDSANGSDNTFSTGSPGSGWMSPTSTTDPDGNWENEINVYDDELTTYAQHYHDINDPDGTWSSFIYLIPPTSITSDKIRYYARKGSNMLNIDIDVYDGATWTGVYQGTYADNTWETKAFTQRTVIQARVRFQLNANNVGLYWEFYEFDFYSISLNAPTLTWTGEANYVSDGLDPHTGYSSTDFEFRVEYTDADNDGPTVIQVWVDKNGDNDYDDVNEKITLTVASDAAAVKKDGNYTNGEIFSTTINIVYGPNTSNCSYKFVANDGTFAATGTPTNAINLPDVTANPAEVTPAWSKFSLGEVNGGAIGESVLYIGTGASTNNLAAINLSNGNTNWTYSTHHTARAICRPIIIPAVTIR
jgi:hypothetical protein